MAVSVGAVIVTGFVGGAIGQLAINARRYYQSLHPPFTETVKLFAERKFMVKEEMLNWNGHHIRWTIVQSPEDKITGVYSEKHTWSTQGSRNACQLELEEKARKFYETTLD
jgi:hypothetical protein